VGPEDEAGEPEGSDSPASMRRPVDQQPLLVIEPFASMLRSQ
jgi:hypothetical protein